MTEYIKLQIAEKVANQLRLAFPLGVDKEDSAEWLNLPNGDAYEAVALRFARAYRAIEEEKSAKFNPRTYTMTDEEAQMTLRLYSKSINADRLIDRFVQVIRQGKIEEVNIVDEVKKFAETVKV